MFVFVANKYKAINRAKKIGGDEVSTALSLVGYPEQVQAAMEYVFGNAFVCSGNESSYIIIFLILRQ